MLQPEKLVLLEDGLNNAVEFVHECERSWITGAEVICWMDDAGKERPHNWVTVDSMDVLLAKMRQLS
jgi:hypothetical protein